MAVYKYNHLGSKYLDGKSPFNVIYGFEPDYLSAWIYIKSFEESDDSYNRASYNVPDQVNNWMKLHSNLLTEKVKVIIICTQQIRTIYKNMWKN